MSDAQKPLIINNFQKAVADSPHVGHALMRNIDIELQPGAMKSKTRFRSMFNSVNQVTFTADPVTDICTGSSSLRTQAEIDNGNNYYYAPVTFTTTGTLPAGLSLNTIYYLIYLSDTTFKVSNTWANADGGVYINITDAGTGVHTVVPVPMGTINHIRRDSRTNYYFAIDSNGRVWNSRGSTSVYLLTGNGTTGANGNGLSLFKTSDGQHTYLFAFRSDKIDVVDVWGNTQINAASWTNDWKSLNSGAGSGNPHNTILAQDNITYFCDDRYVGSIVENAGSVFDPSSAGTYTFNNQALSLPLNEIAYCFEELGVKLLTGGLTFNKIYPWDRVSPSFTLPIAVPEKGIYRLRNVGNLIYIFAGRKGNVYTTQGTYVKLFKTIPGYIRNNTTSASSVPILYGDAVLRSNGAVLFGLQTQTTANNGVYLLYPDGRILMDNTPYGGATNVTAIWADDDFYVIGYSGGMDYMDSSMYAAGTFASVYQSALYRVGNKTQKASYHQVEIQIAKPAANGQIRVGWRFDTGNGTSFTTNSATTFTTDGVNTSFQNSEWGITDIENIQLQLEFDADVEIVEVRLNP